jgi:hypothetical protein
MVGSLQPSVHELQDLGAFVSSNDLLTHNRCITETNTQPMGGTRAIHNELHAVGCLAWLVNGSDEATVLQFVHRAPYLATSATMHLRKCHDTVVMPVRCATCSVDNTSALGWCWHWSHVCAGSVWTEPCRAPHLSSRRCCRHRGRAHGIGNTASTDWHQQQEPATI